MKSGQNRRSNNQNNNNYDNLDLTMTTIIENGSCKGDDDEEKRMLWS